jgi:hypothetical protein
MPPPALTFRLLTGCRAFTDRGIGFLEGQGELNAGTVFDGFEGPNARAFRSRMDQWLDGANGPKSHFHNFKHDFEHRNCFVFKYNEHRLYGFLCHPSADDPRFQLCSLCIYATKYEHLSDRSELDRVEQWCRSLRAAETISRIYPKTKNQKGGSPWKN